jgi:hypothetical protein
MLKLIMVLWLAGSGCVNEGGDHRLFGKFGCAIQRALSFKSNTPPKWLVAKHDQAGDVTFGIAFPFYVFSQHESGGKWSRFYLGYRFDTNWPGYIAAAELKLHQPNALPKGY